MPSFNPITPILTIEGDPVKSGQCKDPAMRAKIVKLQVELAQAPEDQKPVLDAALNAFATDAQPNLTVGGTMMAALAGNPLRGDDTLEAGPKVDHWAWAMKIGSAIAAGQNMVSFDQSVIDRIKARVNLGYPQAFVVAQVFAAIKPDEPPSAG